MGKKLAFTLMEIIIIVALISLLLVAIFVFLNPSKQIQKTKDTKRKTELTQLQKVLEDWYNDKGCYPKPEEICYDSILENNTCHICGKETTSPSIAPYLHSLICDPDHPNKKYIYQVDDLLCPKKYRIYTDLNNQSDPEIAKLGCQNGCGPYLDCNYNYGITSPNESIEYCTRFTSPTATPTTPVYLDNCSNYNPIYIISKESGICNICGTYQECKQFYNDYIFYIDPQCSKACIKN